MHERLFCDGSYRSVEAGLVALILLAFPLCAHAKPGTPGPDYFAGIYERVGRTADHALQNDLVTIAPNGENLAISACTGAAIHLGFGPAFEIVHLMTGAQGGDLVECLFHNNGYNAPILTCRSAAGAAFALWPSPEKELGC